VQTITSWQVSVAAESAVAMFLARVGWNVSVQYGANQPEYDLMAERGTSILKISVKGSQDGSWGLTQTWLKKANYHAAIDVWLARHTPHTICAFVQFKGTSLTEVPRIYLASPAEVADQLKRTAKGRGDTILYERKAWTNRAFGAGTVDEIPVAWRFSEERLQMLATG
jgi:Holliday junction resolvase-like predicted endonuclease